ncbi:TPA: acetolactate synthase 2 small subunit [Providencia stuartii]|uniref:Acetolactate synthase 2 small subunit n=3 Tax=Providencia stuartii TaxID=588 RepID=A0AAJ1NAH1_PROST|nr:MULTISPECIES: acetolactate synthase 2 small subunit [Providencia]SST03831.1 Acetolactate synthase isozyme 2 small subunit [Acinetobacter baumannii]AFH94165.1 acetolactate synthase 2 regulatory subunit [Providencia stuartii MRSN 2154]AIN63908.1 acetolactate synthase isozyme 2 small subunit [Providencia stuartii]AMG67497.1 acetolactate synthase 2 small subunit [Providencia stuartii]APG52094.1 acetolactate synthase 2 regulatory subunit [Providencia stuartii]
MMQHQLAILARFRPEVLERILRVTRHRGFQISSMTMDHMPDGDNVNIEMTVNSQRPLAQLYAQLTKLSDVSEVEIREQESRLLRTQSAM